MTDEEKQLQHFLIVRTDRLGDIVLTLPMASAIKKVLPDSKVSFLVREYTRPIVERCPDVDEVQVATSLKLGDLLKSFRKSKANTAYFPSPKFPLAVAAFLARIPKRVGTGYRWYSFLFTHKIYEHRKTAEHNEAEYNLRMLRASNINSDLAPLPNILLHQEERMAVEDWLRFELGSTSAKFAVLHIPSGGSSKDWPFERFIDLAKLLTLEHNLTVVLTGTIEERDRLTRAAEQIGTSAHLFIGHPLEELAALLAKASLVVSNSSGPGHLASAMGVSTIGLFPLPPALSKERWGFRGEHVINLAPQPKDGCPTCQECTCMERLNIEAVREGVNSLIMTAA